MTIAKVSLHRILNLIAACFWDVGKLPDIKQLFIESDNELLM